jgi:hypothetical protein
VIHFQIFYPYGYVDCHLTARVQIMQAIGRMLMALGITPENLKLKVM